MLTEHIFVHQFEMLPLVILQGFRAGGVLFRFLGSLPFCGISTLYIRPVLQWVEPRSSEPEYILFLSVSGGRSGSRWPVAGGQWPVAGSRSGSRWPVAGGRCPVRWPVAGPVAGARCGIAGAGVGGPFNPPSSVGPFPCSDSDLLEFLT